MEIAHVPYWEYIITRPGANPLDLGEAYRVGAAADYWHTTKHTVYGLEFSKPSRQRTDYDSPTVRDTLLIPWTSIAAVSKTRHVPELAST